MGTFIQALFLSDFIVVLIPGCALLAISAWAYSQREVAGYMLGWLMGIFFIVVLSSLFPPPASTSTVVYRLSLPTVFLATFLGLTLSIVPTMAISMIPVLRTRGISLVVAMSLSAVIGSGYFMVMLPATMRLAVALFILAYAIGLFTLLMIYRRSETIFADPLAVDPLALDPMIETQAAPPEPAEADIPVTALETMNRFRSVRERAQGRNQQRGY